MPAVRRLHFSTASYGLADETQAEATTADALLNPGTRNLPLKGDAAMKGAVRFVLLMLACVSTFALADDRADYNRRSVERYVAMFDMADVNGDNVVSRLEAHGTIELEAKFNDLDIDRDDNITRDELTRFTQLTFH
jgi:hypothetical protein